MRNADALLRVHEHRNAMRHIKASLSGDIPVSQERYTQIGDELGCGTGYLS